MYVGLKQPRGDGGRCVTLARAAAKETMHMMALPTVKLAVKIELSFQNDTVILGSLFLPTNKTFLLIKTMPKLLWPILIMSYM